ncbi:MAG TPA: O-antigen ligase family protein [Terrimicrobiaceae bacterium]|nr:O-antigen ligase family protein [Terrimicrobiaceae bacterium]
MRYLIAAICALAIVSAHLLYGGLMRPVFALPAYLLVGAAGLLCLPALWWRNIPAPVWTCVLSVVAFAGWLIWREMETPDAQMGAAYLRLTLACLVLYLIFACVLTNPYYRLTFLVVLFAMAVVQAGLGAWQFAHKHDAFPLPWMSEYFRLSYASRFSASRAHGFYLSGNHLAWLLNTVLLFALALTFWGRWGVKTKVMTFYVALVSLIGTVLTLSRGGALGGLSGIAVFFLLSGCVLWMGARDRRLVVLMLFIAGTTVGSILVASIIQRSAIVQERYQELLDDGFRPLAFGAVLRQFQLEPLLGTGAGSFLYFGRKFREMAAFSDDIFAHNDWMQLAGDFGLPAAGLLAIVLALHLSSGINGLIQVVRQRVATNSRPQSHAAALQIGALAATAMFVVHSFFDFNMQVPANALLAAACLGMLANCGVEKEIRESSWTRTVARFGGTLTALCAGGFLLVFVQRAALPELSWLLAENAFFQGKTDQAILHAEAGLVQAPDHSRLRRVLGASWLSRSKSPGPAENRWENAGRAVDELNIAVQQVPFDSESRMLLAEALTATGRFQLGRTQATAGVVLNPLTGRGYELVGDAMIQTRRAGDRPIALRVYYVAQSLPGAISAKAAIYEIRQQLHREGVR